MRSADKQIVANQRGDVRRQRSVAELLPARICEPPNINWKGNALRNRAQRCEYQVVAAARSDVLKMADFSGNLLTCVACRAVSRRLQGTCHFLNVGDFKLGKIWGTSFAVGVIDAALVQGAEIVGRF